MKRTREKACRVPWIFASWNRMAGWLRRIDGPERVVKPRDDRTNFP